MEIVSFRVDPNEGDYIFDIDGGPTRRPFGPSSRLCVVSLDFEQGHPTVGLRDPNLGVYGHSERGERPVTRRRASHGYSYPFLLLTDAPIRFYFSRMILSVFTSRG